MHAEKVRTGKCVINFEEQEQVTLKSGEEAEMQFPVQLDEGEGETETGWRFQDASGAVVLHVRILPPV